MGRFETSRPYRPLPYSLALRATSGQGPYLLAPTLGLGLDDWGLCWGWMARELRRSC